MTAPDISQFELADPAPAGQLILRLLPHGRPPGSRCPAFPPAGGRNST